MGHSRQLTNPPAVEKYFGEQAYVIQEFHPDRGWQSCIMRKRISPSWARKLKGEGVTAVALAPVSEPDRRPADFQIDELLRRST